MTCESAQHEIVDAMASRESGLRGELHQHVLVCAACRAFLANQASLASAIDSHLRLIANEPVPPSLLPRVRAALEQEAAPRQGVFRWQFVPIAGAVAVLVTIGISTLRHDTTVPAPQSVAQVAPKSPIVNRPTTPQIGEPTPKTSRVASAMRNTRNTEVPAHSSATEVLVLPAEQQAFQRFVSHISQDQDSAKALAAAAPDGNAHVEIALLSITNVEVKPLEGTDSE